MNPETDRKIPRPTTQMVLWDSKGITKVANIIIEDNTEGAHLCELLLSLRDTNNRVYIENII